MCKLVQGKILPCVSHFLAAHKDNIFLFLSVFFIVWFDLISAVIIYYQDIFSNYFFRIGDA